MVCTIRIHRINEAEQPLDLWHMGGIFHFAPCHHQIFTATPNFFSGTDRTFGQHVAKPFAATDHAHQLNHCLRIAPIKGDATRVGKGKHLFLKGVERPSQRRPARNRVDAVLVAQLVCVGDGVQIGHTAVSTKGCQCFIFGAAIMGIGGEGAFRHLHNALATNGAGVASVIACQDGVVHRLAANRFRAVKHARAPVMGWQPA